MDSRHLESIPEVARALRATKPSPPVREPFEGSVLSGLDRRRFTLAPLATHCRCGKEHSPFGIDVFVVPHRGDLVALCGACWARWRYNAARTRKLAAIWARLPRTRKGARRA